MGHAFVGEYRARFRRDDDPSCLCGLPIQTISHVLRDCHLYTEARNPLRKVSSPILNQVIFGTLAGLTALANFLNSSNAFAL
ncbi:hypothetical protein BN14_09640 [Rhizoctonia solani AG-1 IB]|uniref:Reverse transcriptase zinc-binding domain-containing protein n=1 Tax=Thanatephorus cucumeris (strain AG1-IB / isolate 7/3/14) TaxID=1108050 RepID=M5CG54_THACB|nr:hypothetical protein BN14_09640 [Rhizoctonia solani AG-1 IB]